MSRIICFVSYCNLFMLYRYRAMLCGLRSARRLVSANLRLHEGFALHTHFESVRAQRANLSLQIQMITTDLPLIA